MTASGTLSQIHGLRNSRGGVLRSIIKKTLQVILLHEVCGYAFEY